VDAQLVPVDFVRYYDKVLARGDFSAVAPALAYAPQLFAEMHGEVVGCWLPWKRAKDVRIRPREMSIWAGVNGHGKSLMLGQVMLSLCKQGEKVAVCSFEMPIAKTLKRMVRQAVGTEDVTDDYVSRFLLWTNDKLWMYDQERTTTWQTVLGVMAWCVHHRGITQFVIDSLMKCGFDEDDYNGQKQFVDQLTNFAKTFGVHVHLVCHSRKRESEHRPMDKFDVKGSGAITDMADNVFTVWRNKKKEQARERGEGESDDKPDAILICDKQRHGEWEGMIPLDFHKPSNQYIPREHGKATDLLTSILDAQGSTEQHRSAA
jgi:twinkle protein